METNRIIDIICFSGTGNTDWIVANMQSVLKENKVTVKLINVRETYIHEKGHDVLLAFPANSQAVSPYIYKYVKSMPQGLNDSLYLLLTYNESSYILKPFLKLLLTKDYFVKGAKAISMPNNFLLQEGLNGTENRLSIAKEEALVYASQIVYETTCISFEGKGSKFVSFLSRKTNLPWVMMRLVNKLKTNEKKCSKCNHCVDICPVHNIKMDEYPIHLNQCQFCMKCISNCPNQAIGFKQKPIYCVRTIKDVKKIEA